jgi:hypothetical protein
MYLYRIIKCLYNNAKVKSIILKDIVYRRAMKHILFVSFINVVAFALTFKQENM